MTDLPSARESVALESLTEDGAERREALRGEYDHDDERADGAVGGAVVGGALGAAVGGPVGAAVGVLIGAAAGEAAGAAAQKHDHTEAVDA